MKAAVLASILPILAAASPLDALFKRDVLVPTATVGANNAGSTTSDVFPPTGVSVNPSLFPSEPVIGFPGVTLTGVEPAAIQTAAAYAYNNEKTQNYPLVVDLPYDVPQNTSDFDIFKYWGNLAPWYSVPSKVYGLDDANPLMPESCAITQVHLLYRHGARYPTSGALPSAFATQLHNATLNGGFAATGSLAFLNEWTYKLGAELLTPFGRLQNFELGVAMRQQYGNLLNNFTEQGTLPVFRTESQDRMVKTANNFAAGFFGVPEYLDQVNIEIVVEALGYNNTGAPYEVCTNADLTAYGSIGSTVAAEFASTAFNATVERIQSEITGFTVTYNTVISMLQLCSYETDALGYSAFCKLFTAEEFKDYEYYYDLAFYYNNGVGSPVAAAQGLGYLQEFVARFEASAAPVTDAHSSINSTLDSNNATFPLNQSIYADATHEVVVLDTITAFNLTSVFAGGALDPTKRGNSSAFKASQVVPFGTHLTIQVMECSDLVPTKQMRFLINDAVIPIADVYPGCEYSADGLCAFDTVVAALNSRIAEIDFDYACFGNYTAVAGVDYNGLPPKA